jgi:metallo-beta-lactamase family protein
MLSAHADSNELIRWLGGFGSPPQQTFIVHGEASASAALRDRIEADLGWSCAIPKMRQKFVLEDAELTRALG